MLYVNSKHSLDSEQNKGPKVSFNNDNSLKSRKERVRKNDLTHGINIRIEKKKPTVIKKDEIHRVPQKGNNIPAVKDLDIKKVRS